MWAFIIPPLPRLVWLLSSAVTLAVLLGATPCQVEFRDTVSSNPSPGWVWAREKQQRETDGNGEKDRLKDERRLIVTIWSCFCLVWPAAAKEARFEMFESYSIDVFTIQRPGSRFNVTLNPSEPKITSVLENICFLNSLCFVRLTGSFSIATVAEVHGKCSTSSRPLSQTDGQSWND